MSPAPRNAFLIAIVLGCLGINAIHAQELSRHWAQRRPVRFEELQNGFAEPDMIYAPFAFWFWDEPLDPDKATQMAKEPRINN